MTLAPLAVPDVHRRSLTSLLGSVGAAVGVPDRTDVLGLPVAGRYVVLVVDGLGEHNLRRYADEAPYLASLLGAHRPLSCGVPSTTATSLTSLATGLPAGRHGLVGYTCRVPGTGRLLNALRWDDEVDPVQWQPYPSVLAGLDRYGVRAAVVNQAAFAGSGLTRCGHRGVDFHGIDSAWERLDVVCDLAEQSSSLTYAYESRLDHTGHQHGCDSPQWRGVLREVDTEAARLRAELPSDAVLLVTADHGMLDVGEESRTDVDDVPGLLDDVTLLGGEARLRHVYCRAGATEQVARRWRDALGDRALVATRDEAVAADWFGPVDERVLPRIGDVLVASAGEHAVMSRRLFRVETGLVGFHGSMTPTETTVPLLIDG